MTSKKLFKNARNYNFATIWWVLFKSSENRPYKRFKITIFKDKAWSIAFKFFKNNAKSFFIKTNL